MKTDLIRKVARRMTAWRFRGTAPQLNEGYASAPPNPQQTVDIFRGIWSSHLPIPAVESGSTQLFEDERLAWLIERMGGASGLDILELGPLEGAHTTMLERAGAASVLAMEANPSCYLRCLVVKELLGLSASHFQFGDIETYLKDCDRRFDLVVAVGVLYHLFDPLPVLLGLCRVTDRIFIWTHFFDEKAMPKNDPRADWMTGEVHRQVVDGETLTYHYRSYGWTRGPAGFIGGKLSQAAWVDQQEVIDLLERKGFAVETVFAQPDHPNGPAACLYAERR